MGPVTFFSLTKYKPFHRTLGSAAPRGNVKHLRLTVSTPSLYVWALAQLLELAYCGTGDPILAAQMSLVPSAIINVQILFSMSFHPTNISHPCANSAVTNCMKKASQHAFDTLNPACIWFFSALPVSCNSLRLPLLVIGIGIQMWLNGGVSFAALPTQIDCTAVRHYCQQRLQLVVEVVWRNFGHSMCCCQWKFFRVETTDSTVRIRIRIRFQFHVVLNR
jgi:hypothetical protein